ncbi:ROK family transcriptional regulator [Levilactobacillus bambusae]|uniref:ROK family transcriptional regulator n=1 Tax=Levilactobacillus bambusae TaxID=2024736 RepID=A0A2V1N038_9LACO|nr:ROK family transcriptional regulator [Levilactobacillus bambusae]PWG00383.1 ROK family transcriptional regulator [Levilactobacillus bambusae]
MGVSNMQSIQQSNYSDIYHFMYLHDRLSKQDIADELGLSLPTVTSNLNKLLNQQLIMKNGQLKSHIGRRATAYSIDANVKLSVGVEIFHHEATFAILNLHHDVLITHTVPLTFEKTSSYCQTLSTKLLNLLKGRGLSLNQVIGVSIGVQGLISNDGTTILYGKILDCTGMTTQDFAQFLPFPVTFYHDADCVAAAENTAVPKDGIYLSIGEHLGTAIIINGHLFKSPHGRDGTMEHISLDPVNGRQCYCGRRGCIETYSSLSSLLEPGETTTSFFAGLKAANPAIADRFDRYLNDLAEAVYNLHMFVDLSIIVAGEIASFLTPAMIEELANRFSQLAVFPEDGADIRLGRVTHHAVAIGAAIPAIQDYLTQI